jgi:hypothetical protein
MGKAYSVRLKDRDWGQILDGLSSRAEAWHHTAEFLAADNDAGETVLIEECRDAEEARLIAHHYDEIIASIQKQMKAADFS